jgi:hypothetical protein
MADSQYYPDRWKEYVSTLKRQDQTPAQAWAVMAARYRVAGNFYGANFFQLSENITKGYDRAIQLLLAYSAFEAACSAKGLKPEDRPVESDSGFAKDARGKLIKAFGSLPDADFPLKSCLSNAALAKKVEGFFLQEHTNLQPVAAAMRHLFAHGLWTPHGANALSKSACEAIDLLAQSVLREVDRILEEELAAIDG